MFHRTRYHARHEARPFCKVVGWGPFPLPGEKKRWAKAKAEADELMRMLEEIRRD